MPLTRYKSARTLVRRVCRLPGEDKAEFKQKIDRLREHFKRFNVDVSDICQWLMSLRPKREEPNAGVPVFWKFFLEPELDHTHDDEKERDRWRLAVFDDVAGIQRAEKLAGNLIPESLRRGMDHAALYPKKQTTILLFDRLKSKNAAHRLVLLKAAAEWIVTRYERGMRNWQRHREEWEKEKNEWELAHPTLTEEAREAYTNIFRNLVVSEDGKSKGMRRKNPRICLYDRLKSNTNNCIYAGEKSHGPLCWKYVGFLRDNKGYSKYFSTCAKIYIEKRYELEKLGRKFTASKRTTALEHLYHREPKCKRWFINAWDEYLKAMQLNEQTLISHGRLPHCEKIGEVWEKSKCEWNPHTHLCTGYKAALATLNAETQKLEPLYREWRCKFLSGPSKPSFRYPSSRDLPMPKIFGAGFFDIDLERSVLRVRLDDMPQGDWLEFGFIPWPKGYKPSKREVRISSLHINFIGRRPRVGFRFDVLPRVSRFACSQDEIDLLRSQKFPRQAHDQEFLEAARGSLISSFSGDVREVRIMAVDLGETGAQAAIYHGRTCLKCIALPIVKIDKSYTSMPEILSKDVNAKPPVKFDTSADRRGLRKEHVGRHLEQVATSAKEISQHRQKSGTQIVTLGNSDLSGLTRHIRWMIRDWTRHNAAKIISTAENENCDLIVFESLRGFKPRGYDEMDIDQKRRLAFFAYGYIRRKVTEKAVERGMRVVTVPYGYSSRICSTCTHLQENKNLWGKNKKKRLFKCECADPKVRKEKAASRDSAADLRCECVYTSDSDANAARVLGRVFWGEITLPKRTFNR